MLASYQLSPGFSGTSGSSSPSTVTASSPGCDGAVRTTKRAASPGAKPRTVTEIDVPGGTMRPASQMAAPPPRFASVAVCSRDGTSTSRSSRDALLPAAEAERSFIATKPGAPAMR